MTEIEKYSEQIKQALAAIKNLKSQLQAEKNKQHEPIAIIGMSIFSIFIKENILKEKNDK